MTSTFLGISLDCRDAAAVAGFWAGALGRQVADDPTPENAADLITTDFDAETERLLGLGAHKIRDVQEGGARWTTFGDIEGNEFDLIAG